MTVEKIKDLQNVNHAINPKGHRRRNPEKMRFSANPEALQNWLHDNGLGYRTAAALIGINPKRMHDYTRPIGHPRHRPLTGAPLHGLMIAIEQPKVYFYFNKIAEANGWRYLDVVRTFESEKTIKKNLTV